MDFFEHQEVARRKTGILVIYFALAVIFIVAAIYFVFAGVFLGGGSDTGAAVSPVERWWNWELFLAVAIGTLGLVSAGSIYKTATLSFGGEAVARSLGGKPLSPDTRDFRERRLQNIVEEMAIASGTPVPPVFVMRQEQGINAFAAGTQPENAVIGVTRGCMELLSRDELQGVIAHEFSHILNGDMRTNVRLMGILHGILLLAIAGYVILRSQGGYMFYRMGARDEKKGNPLLIVGLALVVIGYIGVFFGKLIKSAISRQREFLADASAVQFTRNPEGIAGALKRIGGLSRSSRIENPHAEEASHMFFGNALGPSLLDAMATHPPLAERIRRIQPGWDGEYPEVSYRQAEEAAPEDEKKEKERRKRAGFGRRPGRSVVFRPAEAITNIGAPGLEHIIFAGALLESLPESLTDAVHQPLGAAATTCALLLDDKDDVRQQQLAAIESKAGKEVAAETKRLHKLTAEVDPSGRLPLIELSIPALRQLSHDQFKLFRSVVADLVRADRKISLFEFSMGRMLARHLDGHFEPKKKPQVKFHSLRPIAPVVVRLLAALAHAGHENSEAARRAFDAGIEQLGSEVSDVTFAGRGEAGLREVELALTQLSLASMMVRKRVLHACAATIGADGKVTVEEAELLRAISDSLGCPMPPLLGEDTPSKSADQAAPAGERTND